MRKIIETVSTLALWVVWIVGSSLAVSNFFLNSEVSKEILGHLSLVAWSPIIATGIFVLMLLAVRFSKVETTKRTIPSEHTIKWDAADYANAQKGKVVDLFFGGAGLDCQVVTRDEAASVLHYENQTLHVKVAAQTADESAITILHQVWKQL